jgi:hypothetical protein
VEKGRYTRHRVDFSKYSVAFFTPHIFVGAGRSLCGCGAAALATLTGVPPEIVAALNGQAHYPDSFMCSFLRKYGFSVVSLTLCNISAAKARVGNRNVLLISQLFKRNEATWGVIFNSMYYHNFEIYTLEELSFLNKPVLTAYVVSHLRWRACLWLKPSEAKGSNTNTLVNTSDNATA